MKYEKLSTNVRKVIVSCICFQIVFGVYFLLAASALGIMDILYTGRVSALAVSGQWRTAVGVAMCATSLEFIIQNLSQLK